MLKFREFLDSHDKPPPELVALANKAKQVLGQTKIAINGPNKNDPQVQKQFGRLQQIGSDLSDKNQKFRINQVDKTADKILQTAQPFGPQQSYSMMSDNSLEAIVAEVLPVEVSFLTELSNPKVLDDLFGTLYFARAKGHKSLRLDQLAGVLKITEHELDEWAKTCSRVVIKILQGHKYISLAKIESANLTGDEFVQSLILILTEDDKKWKSASYLAKRLSKNENELCEFLDKCNLVARRFGSNNSILYSFVARLQINEEKKNQPAEQTITKTDTSNAMMALCMIHPLADSLLRVMNHYGNRIAMNHPESYSHLLKCQKELSHGIAILMKDLKVRDKDFPEIEQV